MPTRADARLAYALMFIAPAMFAGNILVARATSADMPPVALAFWRWAGALLLLLPFTARALLCGRVALAREWRDLMVLGALGMGVCGAFVYIGAATTTATNIGLIYAIAPVVIIVLARILYGETMTGRQVLGVALALAGVVAIVARGDIAVLLGLAFTSGDLWIVAAASGWALYAVLLRHRPSGLAPTPRLAAIMASGLIVLAPFTLAEAWLDRPPALAWSTLGWVAFLALVPGLGAYQAYGRIQETLGANRTGLMLYLTPVYNAGLAYLMLGETLRLYHLLGAALVLPGIYLATWRPGR